MPLSKAAPREHLHTRDIRCRGFHRADGLWDIEGTLEDTKTYSFDNRDRDGVAAGEFVHRMAIRLTIDDDMRVHAAEAVTEAGPFGICGDITPRFAALAGLTVGAGWRKAVLARMAGVHGCTHLTELLLGPLTTTAMQTVFAARARRLAASGVKVRPPIIDTCHALSSDGPVVAREWPEYATGTVRRDGSA
jgi:hypothetical protein